MVRASPAVRWSSGGNGRCIKKLGFLLGVFPLEGIGCMRRFRFLRTSTGTSEVSHVSCVSHRSHQHILAFIRRTRVISANIRRTHTIPADICTDGALDGHDIIAVPLDQFTDVDCAKIRIINCEIDVV